MTTSCYTYTKSEKMQEKACMKIIDPIVVGIHGKARSGKSTLARAIKRACPEAHTLSLARPLKEGVAKMLDIPLRDCEQGDREAPLPEYGFSVRQALQVFGTEAGRSLSPDMWLIRLKKRIQILDEPFPLIIVPDVRFENEAVWVRKHGALLFIRRPEVGEVEVGNKGHITEKGLSPLRDEIIIENDGSIEDLHKKITNLLERILRDARFTRF